MKRTPLKVNRKKVREWQQGSNRRSKEKKRKPKPKSLVAWLMKARRKKKRAKRGVEVYGPYHRWVGTLPCMLDGEPGHECILPICGHHVRSVGAGGKDAANEVPVCVAAHREVETKGRLTFQRKYGVELAPLAERLHRAWTMIQEAQVA